MENKTVAILVLAMVTAVVITAGAAYAMGRQNSGQTGNYPNQSYQRGMGPSMMGGAQGFRGMMGGYWMMDQFNGTYPGGMCRYWNATSAP